MAYIDPDSWSSYSGEGHLSDLRNATTSYKMYWASAKCGKLHTTQFVALVLSQIADKLESLEQTIVAVEAQQNRMHNPPPIDLAFEYNRPPVVQPPLPSEEVRRLRRFVEDLNHFVQYRKQLFPAQMTAGEVLPSVVCLLQEYGLYKEEA